MRSTVAEAIVRTLEAAGVKLIFGLPGSQTCPIYDAIYASKIKHVLTRHEEAAAYMADAYAKITGQHGICDGTGGPGATNLITGIATAWTDRTPVVAFTGQQPQPQLGKGAFQELDHAAVFKPIVKWSVMLTKPERAVEVTRKALRMALTGRPGPVHLNIPVDVQRELVEFETEPLQKMLTGKVAAGRRDVVRKAATHLVKAERPVIVAGGGAHYSGLGACKEVLALAEYIGAPVITTFNGRGVIPEDHPLSAGRMGVHARRYVDRVLAEADFILAVGCRFAALSTRHWTAIRAGTRMIQVDVNPDEIGKNYPVELGITGDAEAVLTGILAEVKSLCGSRKFEELPWLLWLRKAKEEWLSINEAIMNSEATPLKPQRVCNEIRRFFSRGTVFTVDAGNNKMWASMFLNVFEPKTWIQSGSFGPMGYGLPAAIACKLAKPEKDIVAVAGDGGFVMTMYELATAVQQCTPVTVCILNDNAFGTIRHHQKRFYGGRLISTELINPDFVKLAEAFKCYGEHVERPSEIRKAFKNASKMVRDGVPAVIDFTIDREEQLPSWT